MADATEAGPSCEILFGEVMTTDTGGVERKRGDLDLLRRDPMTAVTGALGVLFALVIKRGSLATGLRPPRLRSINLRSLEIQPSSLLRVRRKPAVSARNQQAR